MNEAIIGPVLEDINRIGLTGNNIFIATAFYSRMALENIDIRSNKLFLYCRLDFSELTDWVKGVIDPKALCEKIRAVSRCTETHLYISRTAHAKLYMGDKAALIGSANLTMSGFGGNNEILYLIKNRQELNRIKGSIHIYSKKMEEVPLDKLEKFVLKNEKNVLKQRREKRIRIVENLPLYSRDSLERFGNFVDFKKWLGTQRNKAAEEILQRAQGKHNLQGHIHRGFYGLRQYLISVPKEMRKFALYDPSAYKLSGDIKTENKLKVFVKKIAVDEDDFKINTWRTYLPKECGGRAGKHGGSIGNLNRMLPLVAEYLKYKIVL